jgi:hypothetical protein
MSPMRVSLGSLHNRGDGKSQLRSINLVSSRFWCRQSHKSDADAVVCAYSPLSGANGSTSSPSVQYIAPCAQGESYLGLASVLDMA